MTDELNAVALSRAVLGYEDAIAFGGEHEEGIEGAIRAYMSALPPLSGKEGEAVETLTEWADLWRAEGQPAEADEAVKIAALITALVAERDEWKGTFKYCEAQWSDERGTMIDKFQAAEAEASRLRETLKARDLFFEFVHRWTWGNRLTEKEALSCIQHHPMLTAWAKRRARTASET